jgi:hypothetical protein
MLTKAKNITFDLGVTKKVGDIVVAITIPFKGICNGCLKHLKANCVGDNMLMKGSEEAALAYALFETIRDKLSGSILEISKTKASEVNCVSIDGNLVITYHTMGTKTALIKTVGLALTTLNPVKLHTKYADNMKFLCGKAGSKEEFNFVAKKLAEGVKKSVYITAVGRINITHEKIKESMQTLLGKLPSIDMPGAKEVEAPGKRVVPDALASVKPYPVVKASGMASAVLADYILNNSNGFSVEVTDNGVVVYNHGWEAKHKQLKDKDRIAGYVQKKYAKLDLAGELNTVFAYLSLCNGYIDSQVASSLVHSKQKSDKFVEILKKHL